MTRTPATPGVSAGDLERMRRERARRRLSAEERDRVVALRLAWWRVTDIAVELGCCHSSVDRALRAAKIRLADVLRERNRTRAPMGMGILTDASGFVPGSSTDACRAAHFAGARCAR